MALTENISPPGPEVASGSPLSTFVCCGMEEGGVKPTNNQQRQKLAAAPADGAATGATASAFIYMAPAVGCVWRTGTLRTLNKCPGSWWPALGLNSHCAAAAATRKSSPAVTAATWARLHCSPSVRGLSG